MAAEGFGGVTLPTGAASSAKQDTGNTSLASIDGKLPVGFSGGGGLKVTPYLDLGFAQGGGNLGSDALVTSTVSAATQSYGYVFNGATWDRARGDTNGAYMVAKPVVSGGLSIARLVGSAGANIKNGAGQLYGGNLTNSNAAIRYLHIYNKASAATLSTDTPLITIPLPPNVPVQIALGDLGAAFSAGISWAFTTDDVAIPVTAGATTDIHGWLAYK